MMLPLRYDPVENNPMLSKAEAKDMVNIPIEDVESYLQSHIDGWDQLVSESGTIIIYDLPSLTYKDILDSTGVEIPSCYCSEQQCGCDRHLRFQ